MATGARGQMFESSIRKFFINDFHLFEEMNQMAKNENNNNKKTQVIPLSLADAMVADKNVNIKVNFLYVYKSIELFFLSLSCRYIKELWC